MTGCLIEGHAMQDYILHLTSSSSEKPPGDRLSNLAVPLTALWISCDHKKTRDILAGTCIAILHVHLYISWPPEAESWASLPSKPFLFSLIITTTLFFW